MEATKMNADIAKVLRLFPLLDPERKSKALLWLRDRGYEPVTEPPIEQDYINRSGPGTGKLLRIPMFLEILGASGQGLGYYNNSVITDSGAGSAASNNAATIINIPSTTLSVLNQNNSTVSTDAIFGHFTITGMTFSTRQTPWAEMRVLGIETSLNYAPAQPCLPATADVGDNKALGIGFANPPRILLKNYRVSGSANLFLQDGYIDGTFFDVDRYMLGGLRAYPKLTSPKTLKVDVAVSGEHYHGSVAALGTQLILTDGTNVPTATTLTFSVSAIVDVLDDMDYGESKEGPYSRGINLERKPPESGQAFIIGE